MTATPHSEQQRSAADRLLSSLTANPAHLWHGRIGKSAPDGTWTPRGKDRAATAIMPGLFEPAAVALYRQIADLYQMDPMFVGQLASYAMAELDHRDFKVALCAFLLVQSQEVLRDVGEAMILIHADKTVPTKRRMAPKEVLRVAELLEAPGIVALNRAAGFGSAGSNNPPMGRWPVVARKWLLIRERNEAMLRGLMGTGYGSTVRSIARRARFMPEQPKFFQITRWKQKQAAGGYREMAIGVAVKAAETWEGKTEKEIVALIQGGSLGYSAAVGRIPASIGMTQGILRALSTKMSDQDLIISAPQLEESGLLETDAKVRERLERAVKQARDHRALSVAKNVRSAKVQETLESAAASANAKAVAAAVPDRPLRVLLLIDISGSQQGAIERTKEVLPALISGLSASRVHAVAFNTAARMIHAGVGAAQDEMSLKQAKAMLSGLRAEGGTDHSCGVTMLAAARVRKEPGDLTILLVIGDEAGENGQTLAARLRDSNLVPDAVGFVLNMGNGGRGNTVQVAARELRVPFTEVKVDALKDPYQVPRILRGFLDAPVAASVAAPARFGMLERISTVALLVPPVVPPRRNLAAYESRRDPIRDPAGRRPGAPPGLPVEPAPRRARSRLGAARPPPGGGGQVGLVPRHGLRLGGAGARLPHRGGSPPGPRRAPRAPGAPLAGAHRAGRRVDRGGLLHSGGRRPGGSGTAGGPLLGPRGTRVRPDRHGRPPGGAGA